MRITDKVSHSGYASYNKVADATNQATAALGKKKRKIEKNRAAIDEKWPRLYQRQPHDVGEYRNSGWFSDEGPA